MKKPVPVDGASATPATMIFVGCMAKLPLLSEHMGTTVYDDGSARETSTVSLFVEDGCMRAALNDRDNRRSLYISAEGVEACLKGLEAMLADERAQWRAWKVGGKKK